ncbi:PAS domain-containing serine/threonine-protein kinase-like isoform X2 [Xenia sp. Carnegie-2017]|uniref:PAS domain-containing serine/threonine-protein kinase-like isoform X2 n=1 Tax=Xenia sp. Carnegie-2017 TaxID=2897299 RepID=UPI001F046F4F|nr:PAS domain-containing serine/threonine-protein kinase-like isoform X2 [Xenia sp. Carnegie-2017]
MYRTCIVRIRRSNTTLPMDARCILNKIMASEIEPEKLPLPPRAKSVPLYQKSTSFDKFSSEFISNINSRQILNKTMPTRCPSLLNSSGSIFGHMPSSPLDRIRTSKKSLFLSSHLSHSMSDQKIPTNQSLPEIWSGINGKSARTKEELKERVVDEQWTGNALHSFCFATSPQKGSFCSSVPEFDNVQGSMSSSWQFFNYVGGTTMASTTGKIIIRNPNKAIVTFNAKTSEILVANDVACEMFAYSHDDLIGMKMSKMFTKSDEARQEALVEQHIEDSGAVVMVSGKVFEAVDSNGVVFPVSLWMKKVIWDEEPRCIAVLEAVERQTAHMTFDSEGSILGCDEQFAYLHGYSSSQELNHMNVKQLIPSFILPHVGTPIDMSIEKQQATGHTKDGFAFPLSISVKEDECRSSTFSAIVWVFSNISGLISVLPNGDIYSCNKNFTFMLFGYTDEDLVGKPITELVPAFYDHMDLIDDSSMPFPPIDEDDDVEITSRLSRGESGRVLTSKRSAVIYSREIDSPAASAKSCGDLGNLFVTGVGLQLSEVDSTRATLGDSSPSSISQSSLINDDDGAEGNGNEVHSQDCEYDKVKHEEEGLSEDMTNERNPSQNNIDEVKTPLCEKKNEGQSKDSLLSAGSHDLPLEKYDELPQELLTVSSPTRENDSGVYTAEDLFRDMLVMRGKDQNDVRPVSSPDSGSIGTSGQRSIPVQKSGPRDLLTSTPNMSSAGDSPSVQSPTQPICEGMFVGRALHKDGSSLGLLFQIKRVELKDGQVLFCIWISKDTEDDDVKCVQGNHTFGSSHSSLFLSSVNGIKELGQSMNELSLKDENSPGRGRYNERYITMDSIGKGAFGFVKLARRKSDNLEVVVKFIHKDKVLKGSWKDDPVLGTVPFEISLLTKLRHPNIIQLIDAFENEDFFQLVMEKHGGGMDMFEFIDRQPNMDEALASYLFRQVVDAVAYLHSKNIVHRDVKDENVILDETFTVKLIDFGSAAMMEDDKLFSTFCGTMEYCSPEVLLGNRYRGPELEIWSMGVTLYTLIFGENPFYDVEETIRSELRPPFTVSQDLMLLICWMLHPDPKYRAVIQDLQRHTWLTQPVDVHTYSFAEVVGGIEENVREMLDEEQEIDGRVNRGSYSEHDHRYLQTAYEHYLESVDNEDLEG